MKDRSDNPSYHERTPLARSYISHPSANESQSVCVIQASQSFLIDDNVIFLAEIKETFYLTTINIITDSQDFIYQYVDYK